MRRPIKWKIVVLGFTLFVIGILLIIFVSDWEEGVVEINPIGVVLTLSSIVIIVKGFQIYVPDLG